MSANNNNNNNNNENNETENNDKVQNNLFRSVEKGESTDFKTRTTNYKHC